MAGWVFAFSLVANVFCAAVNGYTWLLGYPLWGFAGQAFPAVHREYMRRLTPVITVPHVAMFFLSWAGVWWRVAGMPAWTALAVADTSVIGVSVLLAGPVHDRFARTGFAGDGLRRLVRVSAWRSAMMAVSCGLLVWVLVKVMG